MIYTLTRDDMPSFAAWIKKEVTFGRQKLLLFWSRVRESNPTKIVVYQHFFQLYG